MSGVGLAKFGNFAVIAVGALKEDTEGNLRKVVTFNCNQNLNFV